MAGSQELQRLKLRQRWRERDARIVVEAWRSSGDDLATFCRRHELKAHRVSKWARRLEGDSIQFHPVEVVGGAGRARNESLELELSRGATIRIPAGFALDDLRRVLSALDERS